MYQETWSHDGRTTGTQARLCSAPATVSLEHWGRTWRARRASSAPRADARRRGPRFTGARRTLVQESATHTCSPATSTPGRHASTGRSTTASRAPCLSSGTSRAFFAADLGVLSLHVLLCIQVLYIFILLCIVLEIYILYKNELYDVAQYRRDAFWIGASTGALTLAPCGARRAQPQGNSHVPPEKGARHPHGGCRHRRCSQRVG